MLSPLLRLAACGAALLSSACAGGEAASRTELGVLRSEVQALRRENEALARRVDVLGARIEKAEARPARPAAAQGAATPAAAEPQPPIVPPDLAVVRVAPARAPRAESEDEAPPDRTIVLTTPRTGRSAPRISTSVPISEPDPDRLEALGGSGGRGIAAEADGELAGARRKSGLDRAHALESFASRFPRHPAADNALVEAAQDYEAAGRAEAGCELGRRVPEDYPAGDAVAGALEIVARCERSRP